MSEGTVFNMVGGSSAPKVKPSGLEITNPPNKTEYLSGEVFSTAGMVVTVTFTDGTTKEVDNYQVNPLAMEDGTNYVTITYTAGGVTVKAYQEVEVIHKLLSLSVTKRPAKTLYEIGDRVDLAGGVFTALYSDGAEVDVIGAVTCTPLVFTVLGVVNVEARYTERGITKAANFSVTVERKTISTIPSQLGTLTYTGSMLYPEWSGYDPNVMTLGGIVNATDAGLYTATFTPNEGCRWADGSTGAQAVNWTIGKAAGEVTLSPSSLTLNADTMTGQITITRKGDGSISAVSDSEAVASVYVSGNVATVTAKADGAATVTVYAYEGKNHLAAEASCPVTVQLSAYDPVFANNTWEDIIDACQKNKVPDTWVPGNSKEMTIGGRSEPVEIIGKYHDDYADGSGKAPITLCTKNCIVKEYPWTNEDLFDPGVPLQTGKDSWEWSRLRESWLISEVIPYHDSVREVIKKTAKAYNLSAVGETVDKYFLLSEAEVFGNSDHSTPGEGEMYEYFRANGAAGRKKVYSQSSITKYTVSWWLRSPYSKDKTGTYLYMLAVGTSGEAYFGYVLESLAYPVAFCF